MINFKEKVMDKILEDLRIALQAAEVFGLVRTESGQVITGAVEEEGKVVLTR